MRVEQALLRAGGDQAEGGDVKKEKERTVGAKEEQEREEEKCQIFFSQSSLF